LDTFLSFVMSGRNLLLTCDKRAFSAIDSSTTDSLTKEVVEKDVMLLLLLRRDHPGKPDPDNEGGGGNVLTFALGRNPYF
jgi:hypothetical protein